MYLIDTNVISEARKGGVANPGVRAFFRQCVEQDTQVWLSVVTVGELRRGVDLIRHRGDNEQARRLEAWLAVVVEGYRNFIFPSMWTWRRCGGVCVYRIREMRWTSKSPPPR
jgi:predicted nucleic acid-binding protein